MSVKKVRQGWHVPAPFRLNYEVWPQVGTIESFERYLKSFKDWYYKKYKKEVDFKHVQNMWSCSGFKMPKNRA